MPSSRNVCMAFFSIRRCPYSTPRSSEPCKRCLRVRLTGGTRNSWSESVWPLWRRRRTQRLWKQKLVLASWNRLSVKRRTSWCWLGAWSTGSPGNPLSPKHRRASGNGPSSSSTASALSDFHRTSTNKLAGFFGSHYQRVITFTAVAPVRPAGQRPTLVCSRSDRVLIAFLCRNTLCASHCAGGREQVQNKYLLVRAIVKNVTIYANVYSD